MQVFNRPNMMQPVISMGHPGAQAFSQASYPGLKGRVVFNTGAAKGIGQAMSHAFARHGARLMLLDLDASGLQHARAQLLALYPELEVDTVVASITDDIAVEQAMAQTIARFGRVDILLNNAGISMNKPSLEVTAQEWRRTIDIDLSGVFFCSQAAAKRMVEQGGGVILSTASMFGLISAAKRAAYCASKAAVVSLCKTLAVEWAPYNIRVNAICPGYIQTTLVEELIDRGVLNAHVITQRTPLNRLGTPAEIAEMALFLASDCAAFVTGHAMVADGGFTANGF
jgi:NAD(P)-dependent dehydrogenase (short-subunit alcohol dehydrogenase family)